MTIQELVEKYGEENIVNTIAIDNLSFEEVRDIEYLEDRIVTHLEWEDAAEVASNRPGLR